MKNKKINPPNLLKKHWTLTEKSIQSFSIYAGHLFQSPLILFSVSVQCFSVSVQRYWKRNKKGEKCLKEPFLKNLTKDGSGVYWLNALRVV
ncbi:MAG: hypothetical protein IJ467_01475, partial [Bacteroidaceae bacterium]|nr:hypothetical protein [Bacteroidaceae bacterium]